MFVAGLGREGKHVVHVLVRRRIYRQRRSLEAWKGSWKGRM
jgi:hypothetical protein